jgi:hypothetical protein
MDMKKAGYGHQAAGFGSYVRADEGGHKNKARWSCCSLFAPCVERMKMPKTRSLKLILKPKA